MDWAWNVDPSRRRSRDVPTAHTTVMAVEAAAYHGDGSPPPGRLPAEDPRADRGRARTSGTGVRSTRPATSRATARRDGRAIRRYLDDVHHAGDDVARSDRGNDRRPGVQLAVELTPDCRPSRSRSLVGDGLPLAVQLVGERWCEDDAPCGRGDAGGSRSLSSVGRFRYDGPHVVRGRTRHPVRRQPLLALNKPAGWPTTHFEGNEETVDRLAKAYLKEKYKKPGNVFLGVVHRLDKPVSGSLLFARTSKAAARLSEQFREGAVEKVYWAVVEDQARVADAGAPWLVPTPVPSKTGSRRTNRAARRGGPNGHARGAVRATLFQVRGRHDGLTWLELRPHTGRKHQLRVQLASRGCPIYGDEKYGSDHAVRPRDRRFTPAA